MWIWVYYGGVLTLVPVLEGCSVGWTLNALWNGMWGEIGMCWAQGIGMIPVYYPGFTLQ